ncbi:ABC transporter permease [Roseateles saccharophilus]|uniref:Putative ABC transport system permease protein n=1 Tax=Roseateles saccharophilus TaxID=304 RepID=A0A4V2VRJ7_ROSSA|nr:FtsX-like permease family protein [Roseateles saccharophilus]MDG0833739.1 FtsX-like permease family protein [Roseateles saccharophilus]TCU98819.1 putative ABC transport system permease protein [Roseateles saccharophilus]
MTSPAVSRPPATLLIAWRQLLRDWRAGELRLLMLAVALAVAALCAVAFLSDRLDQGLRRDAAQLLGGDAVVASDQPTPQPLVSLAAELKLTGVRSATFASMARADEAQGGESRLVAVKAVGSGYPLRGRIALREALPGRGGAPAPGEAWVDAAVADGLGLKLGDTLLLGDARLRLAALIATEPDRGAGFMNFAPRVMLSESDLEATHLVQPASRITYRLALVPGPGAAPDAVKKFVTSAEQLVGETQLRGVRLESLESGRPEMRQTLDRAARFLRLVAMLSALLAAVAVGLAARDFAARHLDDCAMLRVLGQPQRRIAWAYGLEFLLAGLAASGAGVLGGLALHQVFVSLLAGLIDVSLPPPSIWPALLGLGLGLSLLLGFGLPPVLQLAAVPPLRVIRRDLGAPKAGSLLVLGAGVAGLAAILVVLAGDLKLGAIAAAGFAGAVLLFALLAWAAVWLLRRLVPVNVSGAGLPRWLLLATRQVAARPGFAVMQVASLAVGLLALALLVLLRTDLIDSWRRATPAAAPDRFVINIQPDQGEDFRKVLKDAGVAGFDWYPMIRGRLTTINGEAVQAGRFADERAQRLAEREFNLSHAADVPAHNQIVAGRWGGARPGEMGLSVEEGLAKNLGLKLGDQLAFDIGGQPVQGRITSLRKVDWSSMRVNFFVLFEAAALPELPSTQIAAYRTPAGAKLDRELARRFPNLTVIDVSAQLNQVQGVLDQVIQAVQFLFGFTLATGLVVLLAAVGSTREARTREFALMRALGAPSSLLARVQRAELLGVGALAGLLAGGVALVLAALLAHFVFEFDWQIKPWVPLVGAACGALLAWSAGWWSLRGVLQRPVVQTLREAQAE